MADAGRHLLSVEDLGVDFSTRHGIVHAVRGASWYVDRGETLAIVGESGSGKSVTATAIMGLLDSPPASIRSGRALFDGQDLLTLPPAARQEISGKRIGMIFQDTLAALNPVYPIGWQVAETLRNHGIGRDEARRRALALLERVGIPRAAERVGDYPHQFSGGQRQRIMIAMAIGLRPDLLIADEPTTALDVTVQAKILRLLRDIQIETGMGIVLITHNMGVVAQVADRVAVMHEGKVVESGSVWQVFETPSHPYTRRLIESAPGRSKPSRVSTATGDTLLQVRDLSKHYELSKGFFGSGTATTVRALDGVSLEVRTGETVGVVGESGSGKTTLSRMLLALAEPTSGTVSYRGRNLVGLKGPDLLEMRRKIQVVFQDPTASLNPRMTAEQIIAEPWMIHRDALPAARHRARVGELLEQVGLRPEHARRYPHQFSGGQKQRIAIARALALQPELVICDEAVSALDVSIQAQVIELLKQLKRDLKLSYLFITHDLLLVRDFADRIIVMHKGRIVEEGRPEDIFTRPATDYTRELVAANPPAHPDQARRDAYSAPGRAAG